MNLQPHLRTRLRIKIAVTLLTAVTLHCSSAFAVSIKPLSKAKGRHIIVRARLDVLQLDGYVISHYDESLVDLYRDTSNTRETSPTKYVYLKVTGGELESAKPANSDRVPSR